MKKLGMVFFTSFVMIVTMTTSSFAGGEVDVLIEKLVDKGVLTPIEAQIVKDETKNELAKDMAEAKSYSMPSWVQATKLKGDVRLRYQYEEKRNDVNERNRYRVRYRLGLESKLGGGVKVGAGLASGSTDPRSTNQTLEDSFETPNINLDYVFAEWMPISNLSLIGGKFARKAYLWAPTDMLWDGDINPEGASLHYEHDLLADVMGYVNAGGWILDENGKSRNTDPYLAYSQVGLKTKKGIVDAQVAGTYYSFNGVKGKALDYCAGSNTGIASSSNSCTGALSFDYDSIGASAEVGLNSPLSLPFGIDERVAFFGDFVRNITDGPDQDLGLAAGMKIGNKKVSDPKSWQLKYQYVHLQRDAFPDAFPDSDRLGGATNVRSHEVSLEYALRKNVIFGLDYYNSDSIKGAQNVENLVQADLVLKF